MGQKKRPFIKHPPGGLAKIPRVESAPVNNGKLKPSWRIRRLEFGTPWGWHVLSTPDVLEIRSKLADFETRTWDEILVSSNKQNHRIAITQICKEARERLEELGLADYDEIVSLRLSAKQRVWGLLNEGVLTVLWWDPEHTVYPVQLHNS